MSSRLGFDSEGRCPDCQSYAQYAPFTEHFVCPHCGTFPVGAATHIIRSVDS
jgi:hypothetical protein